MLKREREQALSQGVSEDPRWGLRNCVYDIAQYMYIYFLEEIYILPTSTKDPRSVYQPALLENRPSEGYALDCCYCSVGRLRESLPDMAINHLSDDSRLAGNIILCHGTTWYAVLCMAGMLRQ